MVIDEADAGHVYDISIPDLDILNEISPPKPINRAGKGVRGRRKLEPDHVARSVGRGIKSLKITLPAALPSDVTVDPNESVYCYCQRISFGQVGESSLLSPPYLTQQMIGCDNDNCELEWVGLPIFLPYCPQY